MMLDPDGDAYYELNEVGARIWSLADEPVALSVVVGRIEEEFDVGHEECVATVIEFTEDLVREGILEQTLGETPA